MQLAGEEPDIIVGCAGGGSNFAGMAYPFVERVIKEGNSYRIIAVRANCATISVTRRKRRRS